MRIINVAIQESDNCMNFVVYDPIANATAAIGAEKPTIKLTHPAINPKPLEYILAICFSGGVI